MGKQLFVFRYTQREDLLGLEGVVVQLQQHDVKCLVLVFSMFGHLFKNKCIFVGPKSLEGKVVVVQCFNWNVPIYADVDVFGTNKDKYIAAVG